jgi:hypothetical protein
MWYKPLLKGEGNELQGSAFQSRARRRLFGGL